MQHRSPRSISSSQSPVEMHDRDRERFERSREHERVMHSHRRAHHDSRSRSPPGPVPLSARPQQHGQVGAPTALPSIHHLHPDLPPPHAHAHPRHAGPAMQQQPQYSPSEFLPGASYGHGTSPFFAGTQQRSPVSASTLPSSYPPSAYDERRVPFERPLPPGAGTGTRLPQSSSSAYPPEPRASPPDPESDQEHNESERGPPKKKRRRQALSCTGKHATDFRFLSCLASVSIFRAALRTPQSDYSTLPSILHLDTQTECCAYCFCFLLTRVIRICYLCLCAVPISVMTFHDYLLFPWLNYTPLIFPECKRRKIKCDRTHPCGPCARRSEQEKCQWHVIEPV